MYEDIYYFSNTDYCKHFKSWPNLIYEPPSSEHPFSIQAVGISYCDENYKIECQSGDVTVIEYIIKGKGYVIEDTQSFIAKKGDVYILKKGNYRKYYSDSDDPWTKIWINLHGSVVPNLISAYHLDLVSHIPGCDVQALMCEFYDIAKQRKSQTETFNECALIFLKILQKISGILYERNSGNNSIAFKLYEAINDCTDYSKNLNEILQSVNCSKEHAIREFKKAYGLTPYKYIMQQRMFSATQMLKNTNLSVSQIAEKLNFNDPHYFSSFFKDYTGLSPLKYRFKETERRSENNK